LWERVRERGRLQSSSSCISSPSPLSLFHQRERGKALEIPA